MQSSQRELRSLRQEETTLINLASKISDQLNRLKVEELALQNLVRLQNEDQERHLRGSMSAGSSKMLEEQGDMEDNKVDLDLAVIGKKNWEEVEEEEEEEEEEGGVLHQATSLTSTHDDIAQFVESL